MTHISERELELPDAVIGQLLKVATENKKVISLGPGEPDFMTPKPILQHVKKVINKSTHYTTPSGLKELKEAITKKLKKDNKINSSTDNIIVTCGSQEAIFIALACVVDPAEQVIVPNPGYLAYIPALELLSGSPVFVKLEEHNNFEMDPYKIREAIDKKKTKAIIINTPSNPTGNVLSRKTLEEIADIAIDNDVYILSDEAYEKLVYDKEHISIGSLNGMEKFVVTLHSFSKTYAMAGFRVGYACGPEKLIRAMDKASHYITLCPTHISQRLAIKALSLSNKYTEAMRLEYDRRRKFIVKRLNEVGFKTNMPNGAFYAFSNIKDYSKNSFKFAQLLLKKARVAVVPGTEFGKYGEGYIRCSYATSLPLIKKAMDRLEKFMKKYKK